MKIATELIKAQYVFWKHFGKWVTTRADAYTENGRDGLRIVRTLLPDIIKNGGASFDEITGAIRRRDYNMLLCYVPGLMKYGKKLMFCSEISQTQRSKLVTNMLLAKMFSPKTLKRLSRMLLLTMTLTMLANVRLGLLR